LRKRADVLAWGGINAGRVWRFTLADEAGKITGCTGAEEERSGTTAFEATCSHAGCGGGRFVEGRRGRRGRITRRFI
jgi:hypothetical protein